METIQIVDDQVEETPEGVEASLSTPSFRGKKRVFQSSVKRPKSTPGATEEALTIMKEIQAGKSIRDQYTVFGKQIGMQIRDLTSPYARKVVKKIISNVLFDAEMGKYDYEPNTFPQPPAFDMPMPMPTSLPCTSAMPHNYRMPNRVISPGYFPPSSASSPASVAESYDTGTNDSDSVDTLLMQL